jgi:hypothetical protein
LVFLLGCAAVFAAGWYRARRAAEFEDRLEEIEAELSAVIAEIDARADARAAEIDARAEKAPRAH